MDEDKKLQKLQAMLELVDRDYVDPDEFVQAFELLLSTIKTLKENTDSSLNDIEEDIESIEKTTNQIISAFDGKLKDLNKSFGENVSKSEAQTIKRIGELDKELRAAIESVKDSFPKIDIQKLEDEIEKLKKVKIPEQKIETPDETIEKINKGKKIINKERVEGLKDIERIAREGANRLYTGISETRALELIRTTAGVGGASTLADVSGFSTDATKSIYTMSAGVPVNFKSSDGNTIFYIDETNERVAFGGITSPTCKLQVSNGQLKTNTSLTEFVRLGSNEGATSTGLKMALSGNTTVATSYFSMQLGDNATNGGVLALQGFGGSVAIGGTTLVGSEALRVVGDANLSAALTVGTSITTTAGRLTVNSTNVPTTFNSSNSNTYKIEFKNAGSTIGYIGGSAATILSVGDSSAVEKFAVSSGGSATATEFVLSGTASGLSQGRFLYRTAEGTTITARQGSSYDFTLYSPVSGEYIQTVGTGTNDIRYWGNIGIGKDPTSHAIDAIGTMAITGNITSAGSTFTLGNGTSATETINFRNSTNTDGYIVYNATVMNLQTQNTTRLALGGATFTGAEITGDSRINGSLTVRRSSSADTPIRLMNNTDDNGFVEYSGTTMKIYTANTVRGIFGGATYTGIDVTGTSRMSSTLLLNGALTISPGTDDIATFTGTTGPYTTWKAGATTRGYIGMANNLITGGAATEFGVRSEGAYVIAAGGDSRKVTVGGATYTGIDITGNSRITGTTLLTSTLSLSGTSYQQYFTNGGVIQWQDAGVAKSSVGLSVSGSLANSIFEIYNNSGFGMLAFNATGVAVMGSTNSVTSAGQGDLVIGNAKNFRGVNAANNDTLQLIGLNGSNKVSIDSGAVGAVFGGSVTVTGDTIIATKTPASAGATGTAGTIAWDADYVYICTATNTWKRAAITTW